MSLKTILDKAGTICLSGLIRIFPSYKMYELSYAQLTNRFLTYTCYTRLQLLSKNKDIQNDLRRVCKLLSQK